MDAGNDATRDQSHDGPTRSKRSPLIRHLATGLGALATVAITAVAVQSPASAQGPVGDQIRPRCIQQQLVANGGFEFPFVMGGGFSLFNEGGLVGWQTNDPQNKVELWRSGFLGTPSHTGRQFAEINATGTNNSLYQDIRTRPGTLLRWQTAYRARNSRPGFDLDTTTLRFGRTPPFGSGAGLGAVTATTATNSEFIWRVRSGLSLVPFGQPWTRVTLTAVSTTGPAATGNLVDSVRVVGCR
jgi:hypothetical protein